MSRAGDSVILEEQLDENYEPSNEEILEYAQWLGMDVQREANLVWIAREGLKAPLPEHWKPCRMPDNDIYYFNFQTGESTWDHPCDEYCRKLYTEEKKKHDWRVQRGLPPTCSPSRGQMVEPSRRRLVALPEREYENPSDAPRTFGSDSRSPDQRWQGDLRPNSIQEAAPPGARRPVQEVGTPVAGGQNWPRVASPSPSQDTTVTKYEMYAQRQVQQQRPDRPASTPQKSGPGEDWERDGRPPLARGSNPQQSPLSAQRPSPGSTSWAGNSNPNSLNRNEWGGHPQVSRSANSGGPVPHLATPVPTHLRNGAVVNPWSDSDTTDDDENLAKSGTPGLADQKLRPSKSPTVPDEHIMKAQEAAYRRKFLSRQRAEREEWEKDVQQKDQDAREEWQSNMIKDTDEWKMKHRDSMIQKRRALEADYNEQLAQLKSPADAIKAEAEALLRDAEAEVEERKAELIEDARRSADDAKRAMLQQARNEVEGEKQRLMQMLRKEMEPPSPQYSQDERSGDPNDKVSRWKANMQEDSLRQREALEEKDMAGEEAQMLESERRHVQRLVQERTAAIEAQLRIDEEVFYGQRRQELEERIQQRMAVEEEAAMQRKRAELDASMSRAFEKEKGDREISMRFELEKEMQSKRKALKAELERKHQTDGSDSGSPSGFMANLLPGQQLTEAQTLEKERAQMVERVRAVVAKEEEQLLKEQRDLVLEKVKRTMSEEAGERSGGPVEDKRMSEGENSYALDRSLSMEGLQEGLRDLEQNPEGGSVRNDVARVEGDGQAQLARVKEEVERQVRGAREKELAEWETRTRAELEGEKERRVAQMRSEVEMLVKSERLKLAKQREKDLAEAKRASESDRASAESSPTPHSVLPQSDAWKANEIETRAANEKALAELQAKHAQAVEQLEAEHKTAQLEMEAEKEALRQELGLAREQLEGQKRVTVAGDAEQKTVMVAGQEVERLEREGREKLEVARKKMEEDLAELHRAAEEGLRAMREKVEKEKIEEEQKKRETMETGIAERMRKNKRRLGEEDRKKMAEMKKEMKARQEFLRAKMEVELEREMKYEREKRAQALRQEMEAQQQERRSQAEQEWRSQAAQIEADTASKVHNLRDTKLQELKEDGEWLEQEMERELDREREEIARAKELRLERLKRETREEIEAQEELANELKAERSKQLEEDLAELERNKTLAFDEARRKAAAVPSAGVVPVYGSFVGKQHGEEPGAGGQCRSSSQRAPNGKAPQGGDENARGDRGRPQGVPLVAQAPGAEWSAVFGADRPGDSGSAEAELERAKVWEKERAETEAGRPAEMEQVKRDTSSKRFKFLAETRRVLEERAKGDGPNDWAGEARSVGGSPDRRHPGHDNSQVTWPSEIERSATAHVVGSDGEEDILRNHSESESTVSAPELSRMRAFGGNLQIATAQLMDELRKEKVTSPERMRREQLNAGRRNGSGSAGQWLKVLDVQNEGEGNADMRLGRVKTRVPVTGKAPLVPMASQDAQTPVTVSKAPGFEAGVARVGGSEKGPPSPSEAAFVPVAETPLATPSATEDASPGLLYQPSSDVTNLPTPKCTSIRPAETPRPQTFETEASLETTASVAAKGTEDLGTEEASLSDMPGDIPRVQSHEPASREFVKEPVSELSETRSAAVISPPGGDPSLGDAPPLESAGENMEISPLEDFDDMESLASTVASARAGGSDAGRRAWEEHFADTTLVRSSSLPRPEEGPPLPRGSISLGVKARAYLSLQRKFLKERQLIIEQARADWKMRMQELDQMSEGADRQRKRSLLMQLKLTLEDSAHRVNEEARQMRALKHELWGEAPQSTTSAVIPVFRTTLPARTSGTPRRWSIADDEAERPRTADGPGRKSRPSWTASTSESLRNSSRSTSQVREPLSGRLRALLARWNDEHQISGDLALEHSKWVDAFRERLQTVGAVSM